MRLGKRILIALAVCALCSPALARPDSPENNWQREVRESAREVLRMAATNEFRLAQANPLEAVVVLASTDRSEDDAQRKAPDWPEQARQLRQRIAELREQGKTEEAAALLRKSREQMNSRGKEMRQKMQDMRRKIEQLREEGREDEIPAIVKKMRAQFQGMRPGPGGPSADRPRDRGPRGRRAASRRGRDKGDEDARPERPDPRRKSAERDEGSATRGSTERREAPPSKKSRGDRRGPEAKVAPDREAPSFRDRPRPDWGGPGHPRAGGGPSRKTADHARRDDRRRDGGRYARTGRRPGGYPPHVRRSRRPRPEGMMVGPPHARFGRRPRPDAIGHRQSFAEGRGSGFARDMRPRPDRMARGSWRRLDGKRRAERPRSFAAERIQHAPRHVKIMLAARLLRSAGLPEEAARLVKLVRDRTPSTHGGPPPAPGPAPDRLHVVTQHIQQMHKQLEEGHKAIRELHEQLARTHQGIRDLFKRVHRLEERDDDD